jgi:hypothetical protein
MQLFERVVAEAASTAGFARAGCRGMDLRLPAC